MASSSDILEAVFRCLPEVFCVFAFYFRRRGVDTGAAEELLREFGIPDSSMDDQRPVLLDLVEWEALKRDWETAILSCGLSYVVLAFVAPKIWIGVGFALWILASSLLRIFIKESGPGDRYRSRRILIWAFGFVLFASCLAKVATVFFGEPRDGGGG